MVLVMNGLLAAIADTVSALLPGDRRGGLALERNVLAEIGRTVTSPFSTPEVFERFARWVNELIRYDRIAIAIVDPDGGTFRLTHVSGTSVMDIEQGDYISLRNSFVDQVISLGNPNLYMPSDQYPQRVEFATSGLLSRIGTPLLSNERVIGSLHLSSKQLNAYSNLDLNRLEQIGHQISGALASEFLLDSERVRLNQLKGMYKISAVLSKELSFAEKAQEIVDISVEISAADLVVLWRGNRHGDQAMAPPDPVAASGPGSKEINLSGWLSDHDSVSRIAYSQGKTLVVNDYLNSPEASPIALVKGYKAVASIPIQYEGMTRGLLGVGSKTQNHFNAERVALLTALADAIAPLFETADLSESLQASQAEMALVEDVAKIVTSTLEIDDVYERFAKEIRELVDFDRVTITAIDQKTQTIMVKYTFGDTLSERKVGDVVPISESASDLVVALGAPIFRGGPASAAAVRSTVEKEYLELGFRSSAIIPLMSRGRLIGTMGLRSRRSEAFGPREQAIILRLADLIAPAIENAVLFEQSSESEKTQRRLADENALMAKIGRIIASPLSKEDIYRQFAESVQELVQFDRISITTLNSSGDHTSTQYILGTNVPGWEQGAVKRMDGTRVPFISKIMSSDTPVVLNPNDADEFQEEYPTLVDFYRAGLCSFLGCRLIANDRVIGTLLLASSTPGLYGHPESQIIERIGNQVAGSIASALLLQAERERFEQLEALYEVASILAKPITFDSKAQLVIETLVNVSKADQIILRRVDRDRENLELVATTGSGNIIFESTLSISKQVSASSEAFRQGRTLTVNEYQSFPNANPDILAQGVKSTLVVPIASGGQTLGLLNVASRTPNFFSEERIALHSAFADELGTLFESAALSEVLQASQEELALADEIAKILTSTLEIEGVYDQFAAEAQKLIQFDRLTICSINHQDATFTTRYVFGPAVPHHNFGDVVNMGSSEQRAALADGVPVFIDDLMTDIKNFPSEDDYLSSGLRSSIAVPLMSNGVAIGSMGLRSNYPRIYGPRDRTIILRLADLIAPAFNNAELHAETRRLSAENSVMAEIGRIISSPISNDGVYERFARAVQDLIPFDRIAITSCDNEGESIVDLHVWGTAVTDWAEGDALPAQRSQFASAVIAKNGALITPMGTENLGDEYPSLLKFYRAGLRSILGCTLVSNDQVVGTIFLSSTTVDAYAGHEADLLQRISNQIAGSIASGMLLREERNRSSQLEALYEIAAITSQELSFEAKCQAVVDTLVRITKVHKAVIRRAIDSGDELELVAEASDLNDDQQNKAEPVINLSSLTPGWIEAFHDGKTILINDYPNYPGARPGIVDQGVKSAFAIPIKSAGQILGMMSMGSKTTNHFTKDRVALLTAFADEVGALFDSFGLSTTLKASREEMALADEISTILASALNIEEVGDRFTAELRKLVDFDRATLSTIDHEASTITIKYFSGPVLPGHALGLVSPMDRSGNLAALEDGKSSFRSDLMTDAKHFRDAEYLAHGFRSSAVVPMISQGQVVGSIALRSKRPGAYGPREQAIITRLASQIAPAVENAMLREQALDSEQAHRRLTEELTAKNKEMMLVDRIANIINTSTQIDDVYSNFSDALKKLIKFDRIAVYHIEEDLRTFSIRFVSGFEVEGREKGTVHELKGSLRERFIQSGASMLQNDVRHEKIAIFDDIFIQAGLRSSVAIPMISLGIVTTLHVQSKQVAAFGPRERSILERLAVQITPAIANALSNEALLRGEARNRAFLETTSDAIITIDEVGLMQSCNPSAEAMFGYSEIDMIGKSISILMPETNNGTPDDLISSYFAPGEAHIIGGTSRVLEGRHKDGVTFPIELWVGVVESGRGGGFIGIIRRIDQQATMPESVPFNSRVEQSSDGARARLTHREIEVLHILADGGRNKDIAAEMTVSLHTVKFHIENLYNKLEVRTRGELIRVAARLGFLTE